MRDFVRGEQGPNNDESDENAVEGKTGPSRQGAQKPQLGSDLRDKIEKSGLHEQQREEKGREKERAQGHMVQNKGVERERGGNIEKEKRDEEYREKKKGIEKKQIQTEFRREIGLKDIQTRHKKTGSKKEHIQKTYYEKKRKVEKEAKATLELAKYSRLREKLERRGLQLRDTQGTGNCMYLGSGHQIDKMLGIQRRSDIEVNNYYRAVVVQSLEYTYESLRISPYREENETKQNLINEWGGGIGQEVTWRDNWGTELTAQSLAEFYNIRVEIINAAGDDMHDMIVGPRDAEEIITIVATNGHYWETFGLNEDPEADFERIGIKEEVAISNPLEVGVELEYLQNMEYIREMMREETEEREKKVEERKNEQKNKEERKNAQAKEGKKEEEREKREEGEKRQDEEKEKEKKRSQKKQKDRRDEKEKTKKGKKRKEREGEEEEKENRGKRKNIEREAVKGHVIMEKKEKREGEKGTQLWEKTIEKGGCRKVKEMRKRVEEWTNEQGLTAWLIKSVEEGERQNTVDPGDYENRVTMGLEIIKQELIKRNTTGIEIHIPKGLGNRMGYGEPGKARKKLRELIAVFKNRGYKINMYTSWQKQGTKKEKKMKKERGRAGFHLNKYKAVSYNIDTLKNKEQAVVDYMEKKKIDIGALQETKGDRGILRIGNYLIIQTDSKKGKGGKRSGGVALVIRNSLESWMKTYDNSKINIIKAKIGGINWSAFYAPQAGKELTEWEKVEEATEDPWSINLMDGNAKLTYGGEEGETEEEEDEPGWVEDKEEKRRVGKGAYNKKKNANAEMLEQLMEVNDLYAVCTLKRPKKNQDTHTYVYNTEKQKGLKSKIDYVIAGRKAKELIKNAQPTDEKPEGETEIGHRPIIIEVGKKKKKKKEKKEEDGEKKDTIQRQYDRELVKETAMAETSRVIKIENELKKLRETREKNGISKGIINKKEEEKKGKKEVRISDKIEVIAIGIEAGGEMKKYVNRRNEERGTHKTGEEGETEKRRRKETEQRKSIKNRIHLIKEVERNLEEAREKGTIIRLGSEVAPERREGRTGKIDEQTKASYRHGKMKIGEAIGMKQGTGTEKIIDLIIMEKWEKINKKGKEGKAERIMAIRECLRNLIEKIRKGQIKTKLLQIHEDIGNGKVGVDRESIRDMIEEKQEELGKVGVEIEIIKDEKIKKKEKPQVKRIKEEIKTNEVKKEEKEKDEEEDIKEKMEDRWIAKQEQRAQERLGWDIEKMSRTKEAQGITRDNEEKKNKIGKIMEEIQKKQKEEEEKREEERYPSWWPRDEEGKATKDTRGEVITKIGKQTIVVGKTDLRKLKKYYKEEIWVNTKKEGEAEKKIQWEEVGKMLQQLKGKQEIVAKRENEKEETRVQIEIIEKKDKQENNKPEKPESLTEEEANQYGLWGKKRLARTMRALQNAKKQEDIEKREYLAKIFQKRESEKERDEYKKNKERIERNWEETMGKTVEFITETRAETEKLIEGAEKIIEIKKKINKNIRDVQILIKQAITTGQRREANKMIQEMARNRGDLMLLWEEQEDRRQEKRSTPAEWKERVKHTKMGLQILHPKGKRYKKIWKGTSEEERRLRKQALREKTEMRKEKTEAMREQKKVLMEKTERKLKKAQQVASDKYWEGELRKAVAKQHAHEVQRELYALIKRINRDDSKKQAKSVQKLKEMDEKGNILWTAETPEEGVKKFTEIIRETFTEKDEKELDTDEEWNKLKEKIKKGEIGNGKETGGKVIDERTRELLKEMPSIQDYVRAIRQLNLDKASGGDTVTGEYFKSKPYYWAKKLAELDRREDQTISEGWVAFIFKNKGIREDATKYRPITILNLCYKAICAAHAAQLNKVTEAISDTAFGFKKKMGCRDALGFLKEALKSNKCPELTNAFMDLSLAFDRVRRTTMWRALAELGAPIEMIERIRSLHKNTVMRAFWEGELGEGIKTTLGVFQGSPISPVLFIITAELMNRTMIRRMNEENIKGWKIEGDSIPEEEPLRSWYIPLAERTEEEQRDIKREIHQATYADDTTLMTEELREIARKINVFIEVATDFNMKVNKGKTQIGTRNAKMKQEKERKKWAKENLGKETPDGREICQNNILLGELVNIEGRTSPGIVHRINKITRAKKGTIARVAKLKTISTKTKCLILQALIDSIITYATDTTDCTRAELNQLQKIQDNMLGEIIRRENKEKLQRKIEEAEEKIGKEEEERGEEKSEKEKKRAREEVYTEFRDECKREIAKLDVPTVKSKILKNRIGWYRDTFAKGSWGSKVIPETIWRGQQTKKTAETTKNEAAISQIWKQLKMRINHFEKILIARNTEEIQEAAREIEKEEIEKGVKRMNILREDELIIDNKHEKEKEKEEEKYKMPKEFMGEWRRKREEAEEKNIQLIDEEGMNTIRRWATTPATILQPPRREEKEGKIVKEYWKLRIEKERMWRKYGYKHPQKIESAIKQIREIQIHEEEVEKWGLNIEDWMKKRENLQQNKIWEGLANAILDTVHNQKMETEKCEGCGRTFSTREGLMSHLRWTHEKKRKREEEAENRERNNWNASEEMFEQGEETEEEEEMTCMEVTIENLVEIDAFAPNEEGEIQCPMGFKTCEGDEDNKTQYRCSICTVKHGKTPIGRLIKRFGTNCYGKKQKLHEKTLGKKIPPHEYQDIMTKCKGNKCECEFPEWIRYESTRGKKRSLRYWDCQREIEGNTNWCKECTNNLKTLPEINRAEKEWEHVLQELGEQLKKAEDRNNEERIEQEIEEGHEEIKTKKEKNKISTKKYRELSREQRIAVVEYKKLARGERNRMDRKGIAYEEGDESEEELPEGFSWGNIIEIEEERRRYREEPGIASEGNGPGPGIPSEEKENEQEADRERDRQKEAKEGGEKEKQDRGPKKRHRSKENLLFSDEEEEQEEQEYWERERKRKKAEEGGKEKKEREKEQKKGDGNKRKREATDDEEDDLLASDNEREKKRNKGGKEEKKNKVGAEKPGQQKPEQEQEAFDLNGDRIGGEEAKRREQKEKEDRIEKANKKKEKETKRMEAKKRQEKNKKNKEDEKLKRKRDKEEKENPAKRRKREMEENKKREQEERIRRAKEAMEEARRQEDEETSDENDFNIDLDLYKEAENGEKTEEEEKKRREQEEKERRYKMIYDTKYPRVRGRKCINLKLIIEVRKIQKKRGIKVPKLELNPKLLKAIRDKIERERLQKIKEKKESEKKGARYCKNEKLVQTIRRLQEEKRRNEKEATEKEIEKKESEGTKQKAGPDTGKVSGVPPPRPNGERGGMGVFTGGGFNRTPRPGDQGYEPRVESQQE